MNAQPKGTATREALNKLWHMMLDTLLAYFNDTPAEKRRASMLDCARKFLVDNGISEETIRRQGLDETTSQLRSSITLPFSSETEH